MPTHGILVKDDCELFEDESGSKLHENERIPLNNHSNAKPVN